MAGNNPFKVFRKNQKLWLAVLGVGTIIAFIILPALMQLFSGVGGYAPLDIAKTRRFGTVNQAMVESLAQNRDQLARFYGVLWRNLISPDGSNQNELYLLQSMEYNYNAPIGEEALITNWLLARCAEERGIVVTEATIMGHLTQLTGGLITDKALADTLKAVGLSERRLESLLSTELKTMQLRGSFEMGQRAVTPATRWNWFQSMNRQITAEVAAVPVDAFVSQVASPGDAELKRFFEENKDSMFDPSLPDSGFSVPNRAAFQYVRVVPGQKILDSITDEEIEKYYEANKEPMFRKPVQPIGDRPTLPGQGGGIFNQGTLPGLGGFTPGTGGSRLFPTPSTRPVRPSTQPSTSVSQAADGPAEEGETKPIVEEKPAGETKPEEKPTEKPVEEPKPAVEPKVEQKVEPKEGESSSMRQPVMIRFVSYQTETATPESAPTGSDPKPALPTETPANASVQTQTETPKPEETLTDTKPEPSGAKVETEETTVDLSILYKPLSEVKEEIRRILALEKAERAADLIEGTMREHFKNHYLHVDQELPAPPMPDLAAAVEEQGLILERVGMGTLYDAAKTDFARGSREMDYLRNRLFTGAAIQFEPNFVDGDEGRILLWVIELEPEFRPEKLEEVKEVVQARWKEVQARPLALKRAEELAAEARSSGKSLVETFGGKENVSVVETEPFTWMTYGPGVYPLAAVMQRQEPEIDRVREKGVAVGNAEIDNNLIFAAGHAFMEKAYELQVGEIGVAFNQPENTAYIIRITGSSPSEESLWERFQTTYPLEYLPAGQQLEQQKAWEDWVKRLQEETGFQWLRKPQRGRER